MYDRWVVGVMVGSGALLNCARCLLDSDVPCVADIIGRRVRFSWITTLGRRW